MMLTNSIEPIRVVVTGMGVISSLGNDLTSVSNSLKTGKSGIAINEGHVENGLRSQVSGKIEVDIENLIDRKMKRFMGDASAYSYLAAKQAIEQAGLTDRQVSNERTGLIMGAGGASTKDLIEASELLKDKGIRKVGPYRVTRSMSSAINANLSTQLKIKGQNYSATSACATSAHCIGIAAQQIQLGLQDVMLAGGGEDCHWTLSVLFDAMGALSTKYNDQPEKASRPYDENRDGFVISGGAGVLVLESLDYALARGANIIAELTGYGATSDGENMVAPSGEGAVRCMKQALKTTRKKINYLNTHGTSTPAGDITELKAIKETFKHKEIPPISSTKSLSGHSLGAAAVHEAIFSILMLQENFIAGSKNVENLDSDANDLPIVKQAIFDQEVNAVMSNSFGFGGTNSTLIFERY